MDPLLYSDARALPRSIIQPLGTRGGMQELVIPWPVSPFAWVNVPRGTRYLVYRDGPAPVGEIRPVGTPQSRDVILPGQVYEIDSETQYEIRPYASGRFTPMIATVLTASAATVPVQMNCTFLCSSTVPPTGTGDILCNWTLSMTAASSATFVTVAVIPFRFSKSDYMLGVEYSGGLTTSADLQIHVANDDTYFEQGLTAGFWAVSAVQVFTAAIQRFYTFNAREWESTNQSPNPNAAATGDWHWMRIQARVVPVSGSSSFLFSLTGSRRL